MFRTTFFALACVIATTEGVQLNNSSMIGGAALKGKSGTGMNANTDDGETKSSTDNKAGSAPARNPGQKEAVRKPSALANYLFHYNPYA